MKVTIITFCLIWAVFANPISFNAILESSELDANTTESMSMSQSSESNSTELQRIEENSSQVSQESSESDSDSDSESLESESEDKTSEESNSESDEDSKPDSMVETRDNSMGSEENVRKSWVQLFARVNKVLKAEDNSSIEVKGQSNTVQVPSNLPLVDNSTNISDTTSDSADTSDSSESNSSESSETSEASDSSDASKSTEESNASDSTELKQIKAKDCVNATQSCESEEYFFQDIGDDVHYSVDNLMVPDEDEREFRLRR
ncbi:hypothetical protein PAMA_016417 [Pampus argenteus]